MSVDRRFVLGLDLDDVTAQFRGGFWRFVNMSRALDAAEVGQPDPEVYPYPQTWDFSEWSLADGELDGWFERFIAEGGYRLLPPMPGAPEALRRLSNTKKVRIVVVTHRLFRTGFHADVAGQTLYWLDRHQIPYWDINFLRDKDRFDADVFLEDAPHNLRALVAAGREVIAFDQPYNQSVDVDRAVSWNEILAKLDDRWHLGLDLSLPGF